MQVIVLLFLLPQVLAVPCALIAPVGMLEDGAAAGSYHIDSGGLWAEPGPSLGLPLEPGVCVLHAQHVLPKLCEMPVPQRKVPKTLAGTIGRLLVELGELLL